MREEIIEVLKNNKRDDLIPWVEKVEDPVCPECGDFGCNRRCFIQRVVEVANGRSRFNSIEDLRSQLEAWVK